MFLIKRHKKETEIRNILISSYGPHKLIKMSLWIDHNLVNKITAKLANKIYETKVEELSKTRLKEKTLTPTFA